MHTITRVTQAQEEVLDTLKGMLKELEYEICPVAAEYQRSPWDFIAYKNRWANDCLMVRLTPTRGISLTPFLMDIHYHLLYEALKSYKKSLGSVRIWYSNLQLRQLGETNEWAQYFPPEFREAA